MKGINVKNSDHVLTCAFEPDEHNWNVEFRCLVAGHDLHLVDDVVEGRLRKLVEVRPGVEADNWSETRFCRDYRKIGLIVVSKTYRNFE